MKPQPVQALRESELKALEVAIMNILFPPKEAEDPLLGPPEVIKNDTFVKALKNAATDTNLKELMRDPSFMLSGAGTKTLPDYIKTLLVGGGDVKLGDEVPNYEAWQEWTGNDGFGRFRGGRYANLPEEPTDYGSGKINWVAQKGSPEDYGTSAPPGGVEWKEYLTGAFGRNLMSGRNKAIEALLKNDKHFYQTIFPDLEGPDMEEIKAHVTQSIPISPGMGLASYAFLGRYPLMPAKKSDTPPTGPKTVWEAAHRAPMVKNYKPEGEEAPLIEVDFLDSDEVPATARGFVPNFSGIAGEISASRQAGYAKPVTASQVKSMRIPGVGKTSYNTQETVMKTGGMRQPFIVPPSNSKAASGYGQKVKKKFGFNPYERAASGFVPNFAGPLDTGKFTQALDNFASSIDASGTIFGAAATTLKDASTIFAGTAQSPTEVTLNAKPLNDASDTIATGLRTLGTQLSNPH